MPFPSLPSSLLPPSLNSPKSPPPKQSTSPWLPQPMLLQKNKNLLPHYLFQLSDKKGVFPNPLAGWEIRPEICDSRPFWPPSLVGLAVPRHLMDISELGNCDNCKCLYVRDT